IPKTSSGKIQRHACQAGYLAGTLAAVTTWSAETGQVEVVQSARRRGADLDETVDDGIDYDADGLEAAFARSGLQMQLAGSTWRVRPRF
ncbi:MAG: hypothetical protein K2Y05_12275, partial [Hyphomicrobiaceae bacterium]|nr:hypothetical protein [Hyphomicrobiaceae bacterium]